MCGKMVIVHEIAAVKVTEKVSNCTHRGARCVLLCVCRICKLAKGFALNLTCWMTVMDCIGIQLSLISGALHTYSRNHVRDTLSRCFCGIASLSARTLDVKCVALS